LKNEFISIRKEDSILINQKKKIQQRRKQRIEKKIEMKRWKK